MKSVLISIRPQWCDLIASGKKTIEVRKTRPKIETPFKCYIYQTHTGQKEGLLYSGVIGEFVCDRIEDFSKWEYDHASLLRHIDLWAGTKGDYKFLNEYVPENKGFAWHISDLKIYDTPKGLSDFKPWNRTPERCYYSDLGLAIPKCADCHFCKITRPPQSWCYVEELI